MAETREETWDGALFCKDCESFVPGEEYDPEVGWCPRCGDHSIWWVEEPKATIANFIQAFGEENILATLSTPREPEVVAYKVDRRVKDGWSFVGFYHTREGAKMARYDPVGNEHEIRIVPLSPYTDEDGHQRCHLGGCRVELVDEDEGTCYYRVVGDGDE